MTGFLLPKPRFDTDESNRRLSRMISVIRHRGPDDDGVWSQGPVGLGHTRLSIIDLSQAGHQPMADPHGRTVVVFNGEVYNFQELRRELEAAGAIFKGHSDTEVIVQGYLHWGKAVIERLRGMFALAIWDAQREKLLLARDRVGKKPLFYATSDGAFLFGSEIKALIAWPGFARRPNYHAIHHYLTLQYVPSPFSAFEGVAKLPPGHCLEVGPGGRPKIWAYAQLPKPAEAVAYDEGDLKRDFVNRLDEAVRIRMISDVPLGAFLSGGVDSSAVVAMMARHSSQKVKTFSIGFDVEGYDERQYARMVAQHCDTDHEEFVVEPQITDLIDDLVWFYNEPYADSSAVPSFYVSQLARDKVTVVLNGDGGDENFLGYPRYKDLRERAWVDRLPGWLRMSASHWSADAPLWTERVRVLRVARRLLAQIGHQDSRLYEPRISYFSERDKIAAYADSMQPFLDDNTLDILEPYFAEAPSMTAGAAWADIHTYLPDDLLVKIDIASMAHSLEARSPLLDQELMAWAASLTEHQKFKDGETKSLMKSALEPYLPHDILYRPKMGFGVPIDHWLRTELNDIARDCLESERALSRGLFNPEYGKTILQQHCDGTLLHHPRIWAMIMLELWFRKWIDDPDPLSSMPAPRYVPSTATH